MKTWYSIKAAAAGGDTAEMSVFDYIGYYGVSAIDFIRDLKNVAEPKIKLSINSPGGDVFDAIAMLNALRMSGKEVTTVVLGIAASAASYLMLAGTKRVMPDNAMQMVHNASSGAYGNAAELSDVVAALEKVDENLQATYMARTGMTKEKVVELLSKDTFLTAAECLDLGLCDEVIPAVKMTAAYELDRLPANVQAVFNAAAPKPAPAAVVPEALADTVASLAKDAGLEAFTATFVTDPAVTSVETAAAAITVAKDITALAKHAGLPLQAEALIRGRKTLPEARAALSATLAEADAAIAIDTARKTATQQPANPQAGYSTTSLWADIKQMKASQK